MINLFNYIDRPSPIHRLTGACKLVCLITWSLAAMTSFYTPLLVALTVRFLPKEILAQKRKEAEGLWSDGKPKKWHYAIPILLLWVLILAWLAGKLI